MAGLVAGLEQQHPRQHHRSPLRLLFACNSGTSVLRQRWRKTLLRL